MRAAKGGQVGANGEWYKGGRFLNTIPENPKVPGSAPRRPRKVQVEPYVWVTDERRPIFSIVGTAAAYVDRYQWRKGIAPFLPAFNSDGTPKIGTGSLVLADVQVLCDRFNSGERWM